MHLLASLSKVLVKGKGMVPVASHGIGDDLSVQDGTVSNAHSFGLYDEERNTLFRQINLDNSMAAPLEILRSKCFMGTTIPRQASFRPNKFRRETTWT